MIKKYNVGLIHLTEILNNNGFEVENNPSVKVSDEAIPPLESVFELPDEREIEALPYDSADINRPYIGEYYNEAKYGKRTLLLGITSSPNQTSKESLDELLKTVENGVLTGNQHYDPIAQRLLDIVGAIVDSPICKDSLREVIDSFAYYCVDVHQGFKPLRAPDPDKYDYPKPIRSLKLELNGALLCKQVLDSISSISKVPEIVISILPKDAELDPFDLLADHPFFVGIKGGLLWQQLIPMEGGAELVVLKLDTDIIVHQDLVIDSTLFFDVQDGIDTIQSGTGLSSPNSLEADFEELNKLFNTPGFGGKAATKERFNDTVFGSHLSFETIKQLFLFLVSEGRIEESLDNFVLFLFRLTGKSFEKYPVNPENRINWNDTIDDWRFAFFIFKLIGGCSRDGRLWKKAGSFFSFNGKLPTDGYNLDLRSVYNDGQGRHENDDFLRELREILPT